MAHNNGGYFPYYAVFMERMVRLGYDKKTIRKHLSAGIKAGIFSAKRNGWVKINKNFDVRVKHVQPDDHKEYNIELVKRFLTVKLRQMAFRRSKKYAKTNGLMQLSVRTIATLTGISIGTAHDIKTRLIKEGWLDRESRGWQTRTKRHCDLINLHKLQPVRTVWKKVLESPVTGIGAWYMH